jgi:hypothetical protein
MQATTPGEKEITAKMWAPDPREPGAHDPLTDYFDGDGGALPRPPPDGFPVVLGQFP